MQLRTRLIVANTFRKCQTQVKVGHDSNGLFQGECRVKRIDELFASVWLVRLQAEYCLRRKKALSTSYSPIGTATLYRAPIAASEAVRRLPFFEDSLESLARSCAFNQPITIGRAWASQHNMELVLQILSNDQQKLDQILQSKTKTKLYFYSY